MGASRGWRGGHSLASNPAPYTTSLDATDGARASPVGTNFCSLAPPRSREEALRQVRSLHVVASDVRRGAETFAIGLAKTLESRGSRADVIALDAREGGLPVEVLRGSRRSPATLRRLRRLAREYDVVVAHGSSTLEACAIGLLGTRTPFVYRVIGDPAYWAGGRTKRTGLRQIHLRARRHVALWDGAAVELRRLYGLDPGRIDVIPNAVDGAAWHEASASERARARAQFNVPLGARCLGFVGALSPEKNVPAIVDLADQIPDLHVVIAGDGPERAALEAHAARRRQGHRLVFAGALVNPAPIYAAADLLLLPSLSEGMPGVVIEAALVGTPSLASDVGGVSSLITHGVTGYLIQLGDISQLPEVVKASLASHQKVGRQAARLMRQRFTHARTAQAWESTLVRALRAGPESTPRMSRL
jgi:glycosyltransferase involved in cell wall biosynthesis